jgi:hypothetical protein
VRRALASLAFACLVALVCASAYTSLTAGDDRSPRIVPITAQTSYRIVARYLGADAVYNRGGPGYSCWYVASRGQRGHDWAINLCIHAPGPS